MRLSKCRCLAKLLHDQILNIMVVKKEPCTLDLPFI